MCSVNSDLGASILQDSVRSAALELKYLPRIHDSLLRGLDNRRTTREHSKNFEKSLARDNTNLCIRQKIASNGEGVNLMSGKATNDKLTELDRKITKN